MCITSAHYSHQKSANWELNMVFFMLVTWSINSSQITPLEGGVPT